MRKVLSLLIIGMVCIIPFRVLAAETNSVNHYEEVMYAFDTPEEDSEGIVCMEESAEYTYEAVQESNQDSSRASDVLLPPHLWEDPSADGNTTYVKVAEYNDVQFTLTVYELENGRYKCIIDVVYLSMPEDKSWDGFGVVVQACTYDGNATAWLKYDSAKKNRLTGAVLDTGYLEYDMETSIVVGSGNGAWCGCGLKYELWEDWVHSLTEATEYNNLRLHLEFECVVTYPALETNFQVYVNYEHIYEEIEYTPSWGFGLDGSGSYSYSYSFVEEKDCYAFSLDQSIHYLP